MSSKRIIERLSAAAEYAISRDDGRIFYVGAVGVRNDGATTVSRNCATDGPCPEAHAESRLVRKLDMHATVYVARMRRDGNWGMARPCPSCLRLMMTREVKRVYYTINNGEYGTINMKNIALPTNPTRIRIDINMSGRWNRGSLAWD